MSLLCSPLADLWPFYGFLCERFSPYIKVYQGWALQRNGSTDPPKENGRKRLQRFATFEFALGGGVLKQDNEWKGGLSCVT